MPLKFESACGKDHSKNTSPLAYQDPGEAWLVERIVGGEVLMLTLKMFSTVPMFDIASMGTMWK